ncbi:MAG TPA: hypothetical protein VFR06_01260 [Gallionellaceae bacterium]|nr:hypothetical protein [Gallionellaceae bacterium]
MAGAREAAAGYAAQIDDARGIKVTVILQHAALVAKDMEFLVILETHTQALNDDLAKSSVLVADGRQYLPLRWEGAPPGGHHRKGVLRFKAIEPLPRVLELQLRLAGDPAPRSFRWRVE